MAYTKSTLKNISTKTNFLFFLVLRRTLSELLREKRSFDISKTLKENDVLAETITENKKTFSHFLRF